MLKICLCLCFVAELLFSYSLKWLRLLFHLCLLQRVHRATQWAALHPGTPPAGPVLSPHPQIAPMGVFHPGNTSSSLLPYADLSKAWSHSGHEDLQKPVTLFYGSNMCLTSELDLLCCFLQNIPLQPETLKMNFCISGVGAKSPAESSSHAGSKTLIYDDLGVSGPLKLINPCCSSQHSDWTTFFFSLSSSSALFSPSPAVLWAQSVMGLECRWALKAPLSLSSSSYSSVSLLYSCRPLPQGLPLRTLTKVTQLLAMTRRGRDGCLDSHPLSA